MRHKQASLDFGTVLIIITQKKLKNQIFVCLFLLESDKVKVVLKWMGSTLEL
jgi:hypothetical protein